MIDTVDTIYGDRAPGDVIIDITYQAGSLMSEKKAGQQKPSCGPGESQRKTGDILQIYRHLWKDAVCVRMEISSWIRPQRKSRDKPPAGKRSRDLKRPCWRDWPSGKRKWPSASCITDTKPYKCKTQYKARQKTAYKGNPWGDTIGTCSIENVKMSDAKEWAFTVEKAILSKPSAITSVL